MENKIEQPIVVIKFDTLESSAGKSADVHLKHIIDSIQANSTSYNTLEDIRKVGVLIQMECERLQGQIKFGTFKPRMDVLQ